MVLHFQPRQEWLPEMPEPFDPLPWEVREIDGAAATFMDEIINAKSVTRLLEIREILEQCVLKLAALETSALDRADQLCGGRES